MNPEEIILSNLIRSNLSLMRDNRQLSIDMDGVGWVVYKMGPADSGYPNELLYSGNDLNEALRTLLKD